MFRPSLLLGLSLLAACGDGVPKNAVQLDWNQGDVFHVAATYRVGAAMTEESPADLDGARATGFGEAWSDEVVWSYEVVETGLVPEEGDELHPYAVTDAGVEKLAVVRAYLDPTLNDDPEMLGADPVVYLVFREERDRLAAVISFTDRDGERVEQAWSSRELGRSWSHLSQSMLTGAPTYLAPWSASFEDGEKVLENGSLLTTETDGDDVVDAYYDDELGGGLVVSRYERGQPWPTWTASDNVEARLLSATEVEAKRFVRVPVLSEPPEDFDYKAALSASVDIEAATTLDDETMGGGFQDAVYAGYAPWAGSWWPLKSGGLVFGYDGRDTISDRLKDRIDPIKNELDALSTEIRGMTDGADKDAKVATYTAKQEELVDVLVEFYGGVLQDLDGGRLTLANGTVTHVDGWSYDVDELSPMDKMALAMWTRGETNPNPFYMPAWEILNHYNPGGGSWWGHCNGWAAAAILTNEPREDVSVTLRDGTVKFTSADIKGLMSESHYSTYSRFYGARYDGEDDDIADLTPAAFHKLVSFYVREQGVALVFDTSANEEVWNFPAYGVELLVEETGAAGDATLINLNTADAAALDTLPGIGSSLAARIVSYRETYGPFQAAEDVKNVRGIGDATFSKFADKVTVSNVERTFDVVATVTFATDGVGEDHVDTDPNSPASLTETWSYTLVTDADGVVLRGTWADDKSHPDFAWVPYENPTTSSGSSENPYLPYGTLLDVVGTSFRRE